MKRILFLLVTILFVSLSCPGCFDEKSPTGSGAENTITYEIITAEKAKEMMDAGNVTIVDVRRLDEYNAGHIKGAILLPNETLTQNATSTLLDKNATILVYCRTGIRAKQASQKLIDLGYTKVYDFGGFVDWPYGTVKD